MLTTGMLEKMAKAIARAVYESKFGRQIFSRLCKRLSFITLTRLYM